MDCTTTSKETFNKVVESPKTPIGVNSVVNRRRHMESHISLGDDKHYMETTNQRNYNTYTRKSAKHVVDSQVDKQVVDKRVVDKQIIDQQIVDKHVTDKQVINQQITDKQVHDKRVISDTKVIKLPTEKATTVKTDVKTLADGTVVRIVTETTRATSGVRKSESATHIESHQHAESHTNKQQSQSSVSQTQLSKSQTESGQSRIQSSKSQTQLSQSQIQSNQSQTQSSKSQRHVINNIINTGQESSELITRKEGHQRRSLMTSQADINNQILHRKGLQTSTEALHATSSAALDMRKSICNLHEQGKFSSTAQTSDRQSLSSIHRTTQQQQELSSSNRKGQQWASTTYQTYERPQKIVRRDNLTVGGNFYGQSEAKSYGSFTKQQNVQKVERVSKKSNMSHITLGDTNVSVVTSYKKEYAPRNIGPCPAVLVNKQEGPFKHTRDTKSHKFYLPVVTN